jgi:Fic family protein
MYPDADRDLACLTCGHRRYRLEPMDYSPRQEPRRTSVRGAPMRDLVKQAMQYGHHYTIAQLAIVAGVSESTVSEYLHQMLRDGEVTREKVKMLVHKAPVHLWRRV